MTDEDPEPARYRTPGELLAVYQNHERFMNRKANVPSQDEIDRSIETLMLRRAFREVDMVVIER